MRENGQPTLWRRLWRWLRYPFAIVTAVGVAGVIWVAWLLSGQRYHQMLTQQLSAQLGAEVRMVSSRLSFHHGLGIELNTVAVQRKPETSPFFTAERIDVLLDFSALVHGHLLFRHIDCTRPHIRLPEGVGATAALLDRSPVTPGQTEPVGQWTGGWFSPTLALQRLRWDDGEIVYAAKPPGTSLLLTHTDAALEYAGDAGLTLQLSAALGQTGEMGQIALQASAPKWGGEIVLSQIQWQGHIRLNGVMVQQVGRSLGAEWPSMTLNLNGQYRGKWEGPLELAGEVQVEGVRAGGVRVREGRARLTKLHWAGLRGTAFALRSILPAVVAELRLDDLRGEVGNWPLSVVLQKGEVTLRNGELMASGIAGTYGAKSQITDITGTLKNLLAGQGPSLDFRVAADLDLEEWGAQALTAYADTIPPSFSQYLTQPRGRALVRLELQASGSRAPSYSGEVTLQQAGFHAPQWNFDVSDLGGKVQLTKTILTTDDLTFRLGESWLNVRGSVRDYLASHPQPDLRLAFTAVRDHDLVSFIPPGQLLPQNGTVSGQISVTVPQQGGRTQVDGRVTLRRIRLDLVDFLQPLEVMDGELSWQGQSGTFIVKQGRLPGGEFSGRGHLLSSAPLNLELSADFGDVNLESALALDKPEDSSPRDASRIVRANLTCGRLTYKGLQVEDLRFSCQWHDRQANLRVTEAKTQGGTLQGEAVLWPDSDAMFVSPQLANVNLPGFFKALGTPTELLSGTLAGEGKIYMPDWHAWDSLAGWDGTLSLEVKDGVARRVPILVRLWSALSLQGLLSFQFPSLPNEGLAFSSLTGDLALGNGLAVTKNLSLNSSAVRIDARGEINLAQRTLDLKTGIVPLHGITSSVAKVPLAGKLLARGADILTTLPFRVSGPYGNPTVTPLLVDMGQP
ncbi:MAG TPA: AsmA-like C-terminal domain-containing protein [Candidatus Binatia bacterium]|nr:AsmA-like C-terminal domain-containing protein [Candidatus Binatia bacterium]